MIKRDSLMNEKTPIEALAARICPKCHVALLYPHPELRKWLKCPFCGYSEVTDTPDPRVVVCCNVTNSQN